LAVYISVMGIHLLTYLSAIGYLADLQHEFPQIVEFTRAAL